ncbi:MAG: DUF4956 domain-containing protein [Dermatophilaceae bacterium]
MTTSSILLGLMIDLIVIVGLTLGCYRPRHGKADLALSFIVLNLGIFGVVALLAGNEAGLALGMGLFGILSIIRLRSTQISQTEVAYFFTSLVLGLVNSLGVTNFALMLSINAVLVGVLVILDRGPAPSEPATQQRRITLDVIHDNHDDLVADLEARLRTPVITVRVEEVDYVRDVTVVVATLGTAPADTSPPHWSAMSSLDPVGTGVSR